MNDPASTADAPPVPAPGGPAEGKSSTHSAVVTAARLVSFALACGLLYWGRVVAIPVALGVLFSFMLNPLVKRFQRLRLPRPVAVGVTVLLACSVVAVLTWLIVSQLAKLNEDLPRHKEKIALKVRQMRGAMQGGAVEKFQDTMNTVAEELDKPAAQEGTPTGQSPVVEVPGSQDKPMPVYLTSPQKLLEFEGFSLLLPILDPLTTAGLVLLLIIMMLLRWEDMRSRLISFSGHKNLTVATKASDDAGRRITRYLMMQLIINGSYGAVIWGGLYFLGVDYAPLWGLCAALFRYVPYIGPVAAAALPIGFSLITSDGWAQPLWVAGMIVVLELVSNNLIEPWLYGSRLGLSAMGIIVAAVAWTFLWGPVGLVMSTPLTVVLVVLGQYLPAFSLFTRLLGDKPVMEPHFQFYQRLLAHDEVEATGLVRTFVKENGLRESIDRLFVPALALGKRDDTAGLLDKEDAAFISAAAERIFELFRENAEAVDKKAQETALPSAPLQRSVVIIWPVNELAASAGKFLQWMMRDSSAELTVIPPQALFGEVVQQIRERGPAAVCVLNLSGSDVARTRQYARRLRADSQSLPLIVARLGVGGTMATDVRDTLRDAGATAVTRTLQETAAALVPYANSAARSIAA